MEKVARVTIGETIEQLFQKRSDLSLAKLDKPAFHYTHQIVINILKYQVERA